MGALVETTREPLSVPEARELKALEAAIQQGMTAFVRVGRALTEIRERRLYRATHETFEAYCQERWGIGDRRARQLVAATQIRTEMEAHLDRNHGSALELATERALRPLAELEPEQAAFAFELATELAGGDVPGSRETTEAVERIKGTPAILHSSKDSEYYTPTKYVPAILAALGVKKQFDLDPCADPKKRMPAKRHFTAKQDGLSRTWDCETLYMNCPWGDRQAPTWADKFRLEIDQWSFRAVNLLPGRIDTHWLQKVIRPEIMCLVSGRITFVQAEDPAGFPVVFTGHNVDHDAFAEAFEEHGEIWVPRRRRRARA